MTNYAYFWSFHCSKPDRQETESLVCVSENDVGYDPRHRAVCFPEYLEPATWSKQQRGYLYRSPASSHMMVRTGGGQTCTSSAGQRWALHHDTDLTCVAASRSTASSRSITLLMSSLSRRSASTICCCSWASCSLSTPPSEPSPPPRLAPPRPAPPPPLSTPLLGLPWGTPPTQQNRIYEAHPSVK